MGPIMAIPGISFRSISGALHGYSSRSDSEQDELAMEEGTCYDAVFNTAPQCGGLEDLRGN